MSNKIRLAALGVEQLQPHLAHARGNWGPECTGSDYAQHPLSRSTCGDWWVFERPERLLVPGEQFKIVVPGVNSRTLAQHIRVQRVVAGIHDGGPRVDHPTEDFDFDSVTGAMWFLAVSDIDDPDGGYPVTRPGEWNRNNVFVFLLR